MCFLQWEIDLKRRKPKVGPVCVILHFICVSSYCEDENLPQGTNRNTAAVVAAMQRWGICTVRGWLFHSNLNLWVIQLLFLELMDFRIPTHTYCQSWGWEQGLHFRLKTVTFPVAVWHQKWERFLLLGILKQSRTGQVVHWNPLVLAQRMTALGSLVGFLWLWWSSENFLPFTSVTARAELGRRCELGWFLRCLLRWSWQRPEQDLLSKVGFSTSVNFKN